MGEVASQITSLTIVYSTVDSDADQRKHQSSASLAFVREFPAQMASNAEMFPFDDVIMPCLCTDGMITDICIYRQTSNISRTLVGNTIVDHSDVVEHRQSTLLQLHIHSQLDTCRKTTPIPEEKQLRFGI